MLRLVRVVSPSSEALFATISNLSVGISPMRDSYPLILFAICVGGLLVCLVIAVLVKAIG